MATVFVLKQTQTGKRHAYLRILWEAPGETGGWVTEPPCMRFVTEL